MTDTGPPAPAGRLPFGWIALEAADEADIGKRQQDQGHHYESALHLLCASVLYDFAGDWRKSLVCKTAGTTEYAAWASSPAPSRPNN